VRPSHKPAIDAAPNPFWDALRFENTSSEGPLRAETIFDKQQSAPS